MWNKIFPNGIGTRAVLTFILVVGVMTATGFVLWKLPVDQLAAHAETLVNAVVGAALLSIGYFMRDRASNGNGKPPAIPADGEK